MPARNARSISFTDTHLRLLDTLAKEWVITRSEVLRKLLDHVIWENQRVGIPFLEAEREAVLHRAQQCEDQIQALEKARVELTSSVDEPTLGETKQDARTITVKTGMELLEHYLTRVDENGVLGRAARKQIRKMIAESPEFREKIPDEIMKRLEVPE